MNESIQPPGVGDVVMVNGHRRVIERVVKHPKLPHECYLQYEPQLGERSVSWPAASSNIKFTGKDNQ